jgi:methionine synthase II (cobalamin-independent)
MDQLSLSSQCGFASTLVGNLPRVTAVRQLQLMVETAREVWGYA